MDGKQRDLDDSKTSTSTQPRDTPENLEDLASCSLDARAQPSPVSPAPERPTSHRASRSGRDILAELRSSFEISRDD